MPRNPGLPHYRRIANAVLASLPRNASTGGRVPSEAELVRKYGVAKNTARRALDELRRIGYITRLRGSGSFSTGWKAKTIHAIGYDVANDNFGPMFKWLEHLLGRRGYRLVVLDIGLHGEHLAEAFHLEEIRRSQAVIWQAPSHPLGMRASIAARRKLPTRLPLLCIADPLGLSLQGRHPIDLVHWDYPEAIRRLFERCDRAGLRHPVLVSRTDVTLFATAEAERAFLGELTVRGETNAPSHVIPWEAFDPAPGQRFADRLRALPWKPDGYILQYDWLFVFRPECSAAGIAIEPPTALWVFDSQTEDRGFRLDFRAMAEVCTDLLMNRLQSPGRSNLRVALNIPVRRSVSGGEGRA